MHKILLLTPFVPSNIGAGVNYTNLFIEDISKLNQVDIVLFKSKEDPPFKICNPHVKVLHEFKVSKINKLLNACILFPLFPLFTAKFNFLVLCYLKRIVKQGNYDILYFDFSQMFLYAKFIDHHNKILMIHDVITQRYSRGYNLFVKKWTFMSEKYVLKSRNINTFTFSKKDSNLLHSLFDVYSIPTTFYLSKDVQDSYPIKIEDYFVCFAMWKRPDNYQGLDWLLDNVIIPLKVPVELKIIGAGLPEKILQKIAPIANIEYLGFMDNPYQFIANAKALISPLFTGAGVKVKVIDALACGTPIIGTNISFEGINDCYSTFFIRANTIEEFKEKILSINISLKDRLNFKSFFSERDLFGGLFLFSRENIP